MASTTSPRLQQLQQLLERDAADPFLTYGIALEHKKFGNFEDALSFLDKTIALDPGYCYAYHQQGLIHETQGDVEAAREAYRNGIAASIKKGDAHAQSEITAALEMIE